MCQPEGSLPPYLSCLIVQDDMERILTVVDVDQELGSRESSLTRPAWILATQRKLHQERLSVLKGYPV